MTIIPLALSGKLIYICILIPVLFFSPRSPGALMVDQNQQSGLALNVFLFFLGTFF